MSNLGNPIIAYSGWASCERCQGDVQFITDGYMLWATDDAPASVSLTEPGAINISCPYCAYDYVTLRLDGSDNTTGQWSADTTDLIKYGQEIDRDD